MTRWIAIAKRSTLALLGAVLSLTGGGLFGAEILPPEQTSNVFVTSSGTDEVHCFGPEGTFLFRLSHPDLRKPRGLVFASNGELHAASQNTDRILVFRDDGDYVRQYTGGDLEQPTSLARAADDSIYVSSFSRNEVLVFRNDVFERRFTAEGLRGPNCIAFAESGDIYVASQLTNDVFRFTVEGEFIQAFTGGGLSSPMGVAIQQAEVYVTGGASHSVVVFDLEGNYRRRVQGAFDDPVLSGAQGIAFDATGRYVVTSFYKGNAGFFGTDGAPLFLFEDSGMSVARSIAFLPSPPEDVFFRGDFSGDGELDLGDAVAVLNHLFQATVEGACQDSGDADDNGALEVTDAIYALDYLFLGGAPPPGPFPNPGTDPTPDELRCH